ncbi:MAG: hypothetical protein ABSB28_01540 [Candidatus Bathyarchaeia archaeon]
MENLGAIQQVVFKEKERVHTPDFRLFREYMDNHHWTSQRDEVLCKLAYLLGARACEILTRTTPYQLKHGLSKPYGTMMRHELATWKKHIEFPDGSKVEDTKLLIVTTAIAKMRIEKEEPTPVSQVAQAGETTQTSPSPAPQTITYTGVPTKDVGIPMDPRIEPWSYDIAKWVQKMRNENKLQNGKAKLSFDMCEENFQIVVRKNLSDIMQLDPKIKKVHPHVLRHWRCDHLRMNYRFQPIQVCAFTGWSIKNEEQSRGQKVSSNIDVYSHLSWRDYADALLQPLADVL